MTDSLVLTRDYVEAFTMKQVIAMGRSKTGEWKYLTVKNGLSDAGLLSAVFVLSTASKIVDEFHGVNQAIKAFNDL